MDRGEYIHRLGLVQKTAFGAVTCHAIWSELVRGERLPARNRWKAFLEPVRGALVTRMMIDSAKAFDVDTRTASVRLLLDALVDDPSLATGSDLTVISRTCRRLKGVEPSLAKLKKARNQRVAHLDAHPDQLGLPRREFEGILDALKEIVNCLAQAVGLAAWEWAYAPRQSTDDVAGVFDILELEREAWQRKLDATRQ